MLLSRTQSYDALGRPATCTQQRKTEPARNDSFSYNGRNELTGAHWEQTATVTATTTSATARRLRNWPRNSPTRPTNSTSTPASPTPLSTLHPPHSGTPLRAAIRRLGQPDSHQNINGYLDGGVQRGQPGGGLHQPGRRYGG